MPDPGVSLIPRGSKSTKKRRTSFRPAAKKSNQNKSKAATAASTKAPKAATAPKKADESSTSITNDQLSKPLAEDSAQTTTITENNDTSKTTQTPPTEKNSLDEEATAESESIPAKEAISSSANTPGTRSPSRKRKAHSLNKKISIGSSLRRRTDASNDVSGSPRKDTDGRGENLESASNLVQSSPIKDGEGKENDPKASALEAKKQVLTAALATSHSVAPAFSAHDQAILNQLASEEKEKEGKSLNAFCTPFRGPRRKLNDKDGTKNNASSTTKDENASDSGNKNATDLSAAEGKKVDATTNGAPSVQIVDGQIVLQESSVVLPSRRTVQEVEEEFRDNVVEEDEQLNIVQASYTSFVTKGDYGKTRKKGSWTIEETERFYFALRQLGTDFGSMEALFFEDQRTRKQLKNKYRKELAKNPDLVQELALNPKYQTELDMTALNIEVDQKRIEAHENEEPPAYEPTDEVDDAASIEKNDEPEKNESGKDYNGVFEGEVVEEDAEEERLAEARAREERNKNASTKTTPASQDEEEEGAFSSKFGEAHNSEDGPNMDDFFGDSYGDDDNAGNDSTKKEEAKASTPSSKAAKKSKKETSEMVSLVPKKTNSKSRRPKIRPSRRKK
eukprot:CAMPEP_0116121566 /NCGR_PEP_ID=MMETSP0329-20121206/3765_1 /TAXON_ID=697910 /ORGANISM="Pseudo-nitzschia arenysensis, Strain B593" /LENGTH=620 /DNA_ID=CAMNT_0003615387 /DNA_START=56 /DNA_END=1918 /DNA_ORIENTATION=+